MRNSKHKLALLIVFVLGIVLGFLGIQIATDPAENLWLIDHEVVTQPSGDRFFKGKIENRADNQSSNLRVEIGFLDAGGEVVGRASAESDKLAPDEIWNFTVSVLAEDAVGFRIEKMQWRDERHARDYMFGPYGTRELDAR